MYVGEAKCPYHRTCPNWIGGPACLEYNWLKMVCFQERKKEHDEMKEALKKTL